MAWQDLEGESTLDLIEYISWKGDATYVATSEDAFRAFTFRFQEELLKKLIPICRQWNIDRDSAIELGARVFDRFRKYAYSFDKTECTKDIETCVLFFLFRIAQNLLSGFKKELSGEGLSPYSGDEEIIKEFPSALGSEKPEQLRHIKSRQQIIQSALDRLTPKHKIIYLTYKAHEKDGYKLPRKLLQDLREELDLSQATIRKYKNESFDTVDTYLKIYGSK